MRMAKKQYQNIRLPTALVDQLKQLGHKGETYADIVGRLMKQAGVPTKGNSSPEKKKEQD